MSVVEADDVGSVVSSDGVAGTVVAGSASGGRDMVGAFSKIIEIK